MVSRARDTGNGRATSFLRFRQARLPLLEFRILGRILLHAVVVGLAAGLVGSLFFVALELVQRHVLENFAGYRPLRAFGEKVVHEDGVAPFRPWLLWILPGVGALGGGMAAALFRAPEVLGGGGDAALQSFHRASGVVRRRV